MSWEFEDVSAEGLTVRVNKVGGGTLGKAYEGYWDVIVKLNDTTMFEAWDLRIGTPKTHVEVAQIALDFWGAEH